MFICFELFCGISGCRYPKLPWKMCRTTMPIPSPIGGACQMDTAARTLDEEKHQVGSTGQAGRRHQQVLLVVLHPLRHGDQLPVRVGASGNAVALMYCALQYVLQLVEIAAP